MNESPKRRDKILAVDDTPETLGLLTEALEKAGLTVLVARDGESALNLLNEITPDLVLMDAVMPGMDGFETCRRMKLSSHSSHLPVIFMTGLSETEHVIEGLTAGGVDYITKPIVIDELLARIRVHLMNARVAFRARTALDATGRCLLATDETGQILWCTPQAEQLLAARLLDGTRLDPEIVDQLRCLRRETGTGAKFVTLDIGTRRLECVYLSRAGPNEYLYRLTEANSAEGAEILKEALTLTQREAEVLVWLAAGKSNRDISDILGISPRTVNKHLEKIFAKLGVENRAAAAVIAVRALSARS
ncbi:MAG TPA: response regulator [Methylocella sp.]|nr:response regulator [Methylocella sp.]